jgi:glutathione synthase
MEGYKVLIITDHKNHTSENSLYDLANKLIQNPKTIGVDIVSRANELNDPFFISYDGDSMLGTSINKDFKFDENQHPLENNLRRINPDSYDLIWLRLPPPIPKEFLDFLTIRFDGKMIINKPNGIYETGSKEFLTQFPTVCPPMQVCLNIDDIRNFKKQFPIVLKPFRAYGGEGIIRIDNDEACLGTKKISYKEFEERYNGTEYLAVKYLKNVKEGDKRIVVINGEILGAALRLPAKDSWICNVAMGGSSNKTTITKEEYEIIKTINPKLNDMGIVMYGVDTLVGDDGKRLLSEINTTSIGGLPQIAKMDNEPLVERAIELIWEYYESKMN